MLVAVHKTYANMCVVPWLAIIQGLCNYILFQVLHPQVHNNEGYWTANGYIKPLLVKFSKSEVRSLQHEFQELHDAVYFEVGSLFECLSFSSLSLITSHVSLLVVFVNSNITSYHTNDYPSFTFSPVISVTSSCEFSVWL